MDDPSVISAKKVGISCTLVCSLFATETEQTIPRLDAIIQLDRTREGNGSKRPRMRGLYRKDLNKQDPERQVR